MFKKIYRTCINYFNEKFNDYQVFIGENQFKFVILIPFIVSYIIGLPFKIVINILVIIFRIISSIFKLLQKIYRSVLSLFSLEESNKKYPLNKPIVLQTGVSMSKKQINQIKSYFEIKKLS